MRKAMVEGQFYPLMKIDLEGTVKKFLGFGKREEGIKAAIAPHAGYVFSGKTAGRVFSIIPDRKKFFLLGVNHNSVGEKVALSFENFETPLGEVKNDWEIGEKLFGEITKEKIGVGVSEEAHRYEHSLEVQIPFLQVSFQDIGIVPVIFKDLSYEDCCKLAGVFSNILKEEFVVVSSDMTHYGKNYRFIPFTDAKNHFEEYEKDIIKDIIQLDSKSFYEKAKKGTICGVYGITLLIELAKLKGWKPRLVDYSTSADVTEDWNNVVGYAGIVFE